MNTAIVRRWIGHHGLAPWSPDLMLLEMLCGFLKDTIYVPFVSNSIWVLKIQVSFSMSQKDNGTEGHSKGLLDVNFHLVHATYYCLQ
jgi:hypothetical protein